MSATRTRTVRVSRRLLAVLCLLALVAPRTGLAQSRTETVNGPDGWPIRFTYYPALDKISGNSNVDLKKAPVVMLLHGAEGDRSFWDKRSAPPGGRPFAEVLQSQGYAVVSVDLRKHGESKREGDTRIVATDYDLMVRDLFAVKEFIMEQHQQQQLNMRKLAIVALDDAVPIAATFAEQDWSLLPYDDHPIPAERTPRGQDVRALVMVSPSTSAGRVQATNSLRTLGNPALGLAFQLVVGKKDSSGSKSAKTLYKLVSNRANDERTKLEEFDTNEKSQHLFGNPRVRVEIPIITFLKANVQDQEIAWQDRRSRTERP